MHVSERFFWILLFGAFALGATISRDSHNSTMVPDVVRARRVEITDDSGVVRIVMATKPYGTAQILFRSPDERADSRIEQFRNGAVSLELAGPEGRPSVVLETDFLQGGPRLSMSGYTGPEQRILLGFKTDDAPSRESHVWGLFFPTHDGFHDFSGLGAARDIGTGRTGGFVLPTR